MSHEWDRARQRADQLSASRARIEAAAMILAEQWGGEHDQIEAALKVTRRDAQLLEDAGMLAGPDGEGVA